MGKMQTAKLSIIYHLVPAFLDMKEILSDSATSSKENVRIVYFSQCAFAYRLKMYDELYLFCSCRNNFNVFFLNLILIVCCSMHDLDQM